MGEKADFDHLVVSSELFIPSWPSRDDVDFLLTTTSLRTKDVGVTVVLLGEE